MPLPVALFYARARGLLLGVGIIKPAEDLLPSHLAKVMSRPQGVSPQCGKIPESERGDISRFLNRLAAEDGRPGFHAWASRTGSNAHVTVIHVEDTLPMVNIDRPFHSLSVVAGRHDRQHLQTDVMSCFLQLSSNCIHGRRSQIGWSS